MIRHDIRFARYSTANGETVAVLEHTLPGRPNANHAALLTKVEAITRHMNMQAAGKPDHWMEDVLKNWPTK